MAAWPSDSLQLCKHPDSHGTYYWHKMCCNPVIFTEAWNLLHQLFGSLVQMIFLYCPLSHEVGRNFGEGPAAAGWGWHSERHDRESRVISKGCSPPLSSRVVP